MEMWSLGCKQSGLLCKLCDDIWWERQIDLEDFMAFNDKSFICH